MAPWGIGEPIDHDDEGRPIYASYRPLPPELAPDYEGTTDEVTGWTWLDILSVWPAVTCDLAALYGVHLGGSEGRALPWHHTRVLVESLLSTRGSRTLSALRALHPSDTPEE